MNGGALNTESEARRIVTALGDLTDVSNIPADTRFWIAEDRKSWGHGSSRGAAPLQPGQLEVDVSEFVAFHRTEQEQRVTDLIAAASNIRPDTFRPSHELTDPALPTALRSAGLKLVRAHKHLNALHDIFNAYGESNRVLLTEPSGAVPDNDGCILYTLKFDPIDDEVSLVVGDVATNARAALDHLAWGVSDRSQREAKKANVKFAQVHGPNTQTPGVAPAKIRSATPGASSIAHNIIDSFQCYDPSDPHHRADYIPLDWLGTIVNGDKHRVVTPTQAAAGRIFAIGANDNFVTASDPVFTSNCHRPYWFELCCIRTATRNVSSSNPLGGCDPGTT